MDPKHASNNRNADRRPGGGEFKFKSNRGVTQCYTTEVLKKGKKTVAQTSQNQMENNKLKFATSGKVSNSHRNE